MRERDTVETHLATVVVVVGGPDKLVEAAKLAMERIAGARVETCEILNAATTVAERWPFAIVMTEDIYGFDPDEFEALARDVAAHLFRIDVAGHTVQTLEAHLRPLLLQAAYARFD